MCARVCPTETLCEEACVRNTAEERPVEIGRLQRYATDIAMRENKQFYSRAARSGRRVAVVGAGPAGLACAHRLAVKGHDVVIYDAREKSGGLNEYGIAAYKAVDDFAQREVEYVLSVGGIEVSHGKALGRDFSLADLAEEFDAVFLGLVLQVSMHCGSKARMPKASRTPSTSSPHFASRRQKPTFRSAGASWCSAAA